MKIFKQMLLIFTILLFSAYSLGAESIKVGVIDLQQVMQESNSAKKLNDDLTNKYAKRRSDIVAKQKSLKKKFEDFKRDGAVMKVAKRESVQRELAAEERDFQRLQHDFQQDLSLDQNSAMQEFMTKLHKVVDSYSEANGFDLVLQKDSVPFASKRVDITSSIIKKLNSAG